MDKAEDKATLRVRDFWAALLLIGVSAFFLWRTAQIPLFGENRAGVTGTGWYTSAAVVPFFIFGALFLLALILLGVAIRAGAAPRALSAVGIGWDAAEALRFGSIAVILFFYVASLTPRVDFILGSGLLITALIYGYHGGHAKRMKLAALALAVPGVYALALHPAQSDWKALDDDWLTLAAWVLLTLWVWANARGDRILRATPLIALLSPLILVCAMAFGFRQNVPARTGLIFAQIEYHYYVTLRPLWSK